MKNKLAAALSASVFICFGEENLAKMVSYR
jgi:hypothetical protein